MSTANEQQHPSLPNTGNEGEENRESKRRKLSLSMQEMIKQLECPVCFEALAGIRIFQCNKGHHLCETCKSKYTRCPTCNAPVGQIRSFGLESMADTFVFDCKNEKCSSSFKGSEMRAHSKVCEFRKFVCSEKSGKMKCKGTLFDGAQFETHLKIQHGARQRSLFFWDTFSFNLGVQEFKKWKLSYFELGDKMFLINKRIQDNNLYIWFTLVGVESVAKEYNCSIKFREISDKTRSIHWNHRVHSHYLTFQEIKETGDVACLGTNQLKTYCVEIDNKLTCAAMYQIIKSSDVDAGSDDSDTDSSEESENWIISPMV